MSESGRKGKIKLHKCKSENDRKTVNFHPTHTKKNKRTNVKEGMRTSKREADKTLQTKSLQIFMGK